jgi:hypothetical protein
MENPMKNFSKWLLAILWLIISPSIVLGGTWTSNQFIYKPGLGARGQQEKAPFDSGLDRIDARLGKEIWVGDPNYGNTLQAAITAIGSINALLRLPVGTWDITDNFTIPANITLRPERGAIISIADTKTLSINGGLEAGLFEVFSGGGKVSFCAGAISEAHPIWFGVSGAKTPANNALYLQRAINSIQGTGIPLRLPPVTTTIDLTASPHCLKVTAALTVIGYGDHTVLRCLPATITNFCIVAFSMGSGVNLTLKNLTIQGPDDPGTLGPGANDYILTAGVYGEFAGNLRMERVKVTGQFAWAMQHYDSPVGSTKTIIEAKDCDFTAVVGCVYSPNLGGRLKQTHFINSKFHDLMGVSTPTTVNGSILYIDPNCSILIDGCSFNNIACRTVFQAYCTTQNAGVPAYCRVINSTFNNFAGNAIYTSKWITSEVVNCRLVSSSALTTAGVVIMGGDVSIRDCTIYAFNPIQALVLPASGSVAISNCFLYPTGAASAGISTAYGNSTKWYIDNVKIFGDSTSYFGISNQPNSGDNIWYINNLYVSGVTTAGFKTSAHGSTKYFLNNCVFDMNAMGIQSYGGTLEAEVNNCRFLQSSVIPISFLGETSGVVRGSDNYFQYGRPNTDANYQKFSPRKGVGSDLTSGSSITISPNFDAYHVTGTAQINTISLGGFNWLEGMIYLIADGAWSLGNSGNVRHRTTGVRNLNELVALMYDPKTQLWYE